MELDLRGTGFLFLLTSNLKGVFVSAGIGPSDRGCLFINCYAGVGFNPQA
jgi:hypothetical protein